VYSGSSKDTATWLARRGCRFIGLDLRGDVNEAARVGHVAVVQEETPVRFVRVLIQMVDSGVLKSGGAPLDAVNDVPFVEQELRQISAVLAGNSGDPKRLWLIMLYPVNVTAGG